MRGHALHHLYLGTTGKAQGTSYDHRYLVGGMPREGVFDLRTRVYGCTADWVGHRPQYVVYGPLATAHRLMYEGRTMAAEGSVWS